MAVQARHPSHGAYPHDLHAYGAMDDATVGSSVFLDEYGVCVPPMVTGIGNTTVLSDFPRSDLTCNYGFDPRERARVAAAAAAAAAGCYLEDQRAVLPPAATQQGLVPVPSGDVQSSRAVGSSAASTSGRVANGASVVSRDLLSSLLYQQGVEIDALIRLESERMRAGLQEARRRRARALLAAEAELERALRRNAELEEKARQTGAECQAWMGIARSHEAVAAGLRATLDQLLQSPCTAAAVGEGEAGDARSCCFEAPAADVNDDAASRSMAAAAACKACDGGGEACVLLLPCRHLCVCRACEAAVDGGPVCAATKNASLHVLLS